MFHLVLFQVTKLIYDVNTKAGDTYEGYYSIPFTLLQFISLVAEICTQATGFEGIYESASFLQCQHFKKNEHFQL